MSPLTPLFLLPSILHMVQNKTQRDCFIPQFFFVVVVVFPQLLPITHRKRKKLRNMRGSWLSDWSVLISEVYFNEGRTFVYLHPAKPKTLYNGLKLDLFLFWIVYHFIPFQSVFLKLYIGFLKVFLPHWKSPQNNHSFFLFFANAFACSK